MELINQIATDINIPKLANTTLDIGLKAVLPDFFENDVIEIKNAFINEGFSAGLETAKEKAEDTWNSIKGLFSGEFSNVSEIKKLVQKNGILDTASNLIDSISKKLMDLNIINKSTYNLIKTGKKEIMCVLKDELNTYYQIDEYDFEKLQSQIQSWKQSYMDGDLEGMQKNAKQIEQNLEKNRSLQTVLNQAQTIQKAQKFLNLKGSIDKLTPAEKKVLDGI